MLYKQTLRTFTTCKLKLELYFIFMQAKWSEFSGNVNLCLQTIELCRSPLPATHIPSLLLLLHPKLTFITLHVCRRFMCFLFAIFSSGTMFDKWIIWRRNKRYIAAEQRESRREKAKNLRFLSRSVLTFASFPFVWSVWIISPTSHFVR